MNDSLKFKGEVIARNKLTGEILFKKTNCIVEGGRLLTLAKAMGLNNAHMTALSEAIQDPTLKSWFENAGEDSGKYYIKYYKVGYDTTEAGSLKPLSVNTQATDLPSLATINPWYFGTVDYFTKEDCRHTVKDDIPQEYYSEEDSYSWPDTGVAQPIINVIPSFDSLFIRYKLNLSMPSELTNTTDDTDRTNKWHNADLTKPYVTVNELGLFVTSDNDDADHDLLMFSLLKFPPITLQSEMQVEFEYRIYG